LEGPEVGDGNLNFIFIVTSGAEGSVRFGSNSELRANRTHFQSTPQSGRDCSGCPS